MTKIVLYIKSVGEKCANNILYFFFKNFTTMSVLYSSIFLVSSIIIEYKLNNVQDYNLELIKGYKLKIISGFISKCYLWNENFIPNYEVISLKNTFSKNTNQIEIDLLFDLIENYNNNKTTKYCISEKDWDSYMQFYSDANNLRLIKKYNLSLDIDKMLKNVNKFNEHENLLKTKKWSQLILLSLIVKDFILVNILIGSE